MNSCPFSLPLLITKSFIPLYFFSTFLFSTFSTFNFFLLFSTFFSVLFLYLFPAFSTFSTFPLLYFFSLLFSTFCSLLFLYLFFVLFYPFSSSCVLFSFFFFLFLFLCLPPTQPLIKMYISPLPTLAPRVLAFFLFFFYQEATRKHNC